MTKFCQAIVTAVVASLALSVPAFAACGDNVDGARVACRCGDVVVSDTRLQPGDPIVAGPCMTDGLIVRAPSGTDSIRLDLGGLAIRGSGRGTGIRVMSGGKLGATIVGGDGPGRGEVLGFGTGFRASGQRSVRELRGISFTANVRDGMTLRGDSVAVVDVQAERNGRDGLHVGGRSPRIEDVGAQQNGGTGLRVTAPGAAIGTAVTAGNRRAQMRTNERAAEEPSR
jgi:hypothetical protein